MVRQDSRISDGALIVALCQATSDAGSVALLSLLKLDPAAGFRTEEATLDGKRVVRLVVEDDILPSVRERLQKAAFVVPDGTGFDYRLLVVDKQVAPEAQWFISDYLGAEAILGPRERTDRLYDAFKKARNEVEPDLSATRLVALERALDGALAATHVNLDALIPTLPVPEDIRTRIDARVSQELPDREFALDPEFGRSLVRRVIYEGDNSLRLSVPEEFFDQMVDVDDVEGEDPPLRLVTIKTRTWRKK